MLEEQRTGDTRSLKRKTGVKISTINNTLEFFPGGVVSWNEMNKKVLEVIDVLPSPFPGRQ